MPFINIKLYAGRDEETLKKLAVDVGDAAMKSLGIGPEAFTIAVQPVQKEQWKEQVGDPEVKDNPYVLIKAQPREDWLK
ncbi:tautomerase family protein [Eubacteriales bacterium OttesenSCG-928-M02]|nr:tautomerase family protein [Eubacteriales bacterium OttesenSCG-928-M02]